MAAGGLITLSWPSRDLSPNGRVHYMRLHRAKKTAKMAAFVLTKAAYLSAPDDGLIYIHITAYPKTKTQPDADNFLASVKGHLDGIAQAMNVDDKRFRPTIEISEKTGGYFTVEILRGKSNDALSPAPSFRG